MAEIKTLQGNETQVLPRTTSAAVMNDNGEPIENDINSISAPVESAVNTLNAVTGASAYNVAQSLDELQSVKSDLKAALAEKGQSVGDVFSTYPAAVRAIETGGVFTPVEIRLSGDGTAQVYDCEQRQWVSLSSSYISVKTSNFLIIHKGADLYSSSNIISDEYQNLSFDNAYSYAGNSLIIKPTDYPDGFSGLTNVKVTLYYDRM